MVSVLIKDIFRKKEKYEGKNIRIEGWIRTMRVSKTFAFIEVNDGSFFKNLQVVFDEGLKNFEEVSKYPISTPIKVEGVLILTPEAKQAFEIKATKIEAESISDKDYPLQKKRHSLEFLREIAHLRPRSNLFSAVFRIRSLASFAIHKFFQERNFVYVHTPIITSSDAEGAGEMFRITSLDLENPPRDEEGKIDYRKDFFGKGVYLTVSGQLEGEAYALAFRNIYTFGPTFRAENSNTARHASEFWMIEPEIAFADLKDNMKLAEDMMKYIINYIMDQAPEEMEFFNKFVDKTLLDRLDNVLNSEFERITYTEAIDYLKKADVKFEYPVEWGCDLKTEHERYITEKVFKKPVFVTDYPKDIKAFYMKQNEDNKTVAAMDLLVPGVGEIVGGSQREDNLKILEDRMDELDFDKEEYWWYLELRKYGSVKHSGYGLGFERLLMYITGVSNIRDIIPFPRTPKSAEF